VARYLVGNVWHSGAKSPARWHRAGAGRRAAGGTLAALAPGEVAELLFAAVRPDFIAACMVDRAGKWDRRRDRARRPERSLSCPRTAGWGGRLRPSAVVS